MLAVAVDVVDSALLAVPGHDVRRHFVDGVGPGAAAHGEDGEAVVQPQLFPSLGPAYCEKFLTDGVAHHLAGAPGGQVGFGLGEGQKHQVRLLGQELDGDAGEGVLLVEEGGDMELLGLHDNGAAEVPAGADDGVGAEVLEDFPGLVVRCEDVGNGFQIVGNVAGSKSPVEARHPDVGHGVARLGDQGVLHAAGIGDEQELRVGLMGLDLIGNGDGGIDVPAGAAACQDKFHMTSVLPVKIQGSQVSPGGSTGRR